MLRVVQMGLGSIGQSVAARAHRDAGLELVGAVDPNPELAGRDLGELIGVGKLGIDVEAAAEPLLDRLGPDLVLHATGSFLDQIASQFLPILERGLNVVSTCEELAYPFYRHPDLARKLDQAARTGGAALLGSGVNPGFVMDKLVVTLLAACQSARSVHVRRVLDAGSRRAAFQRKVGAGLTREEFEELRNGGRMGHIGLAESAHMLADAMGLSEKRRLKETLEPVLSEKRIVTEHVVVESGRVAGIHQTAALSIGGDDRVSMQLEMYVGAPQPVDAVVVGGSDGVKMEVESGIPGDAGTVSVVISCAHRIGSLEPGLRTMLDVPLCPPATVRHAEDP